MQLLQEDDDSLILNDEKNMNAEFDQNNAEMEIEIDATFPVTLTIEGD